MSTFSAVDIAHHAKNLCLDKWKSIADIGIYLRDKLEEVKQTHPLRSHLGAQWPLDSSFSRLLDKSFESFAYTSSAIRYIASHDRLPEISLNTLLDLTSDYAYEAHAEPDLLYYHILESLDQKTCFTVRKILCLYQDVLVNDLETLDALLSEDSFAIELAIE